MSIKTMIRKHGLRCNVLKLTTTKGAGAQLTKTWTVRHGRVPYFITNFPRMTEIHLYGGQKVFAKSVIYILTRKNIDRMDRIQTKDITYQIELVSNWSNVDKFMSIYVSEYRG